MIKILYFTAPWCGACKQTQPIVKEFLKDNPEITMETTNVDKEPEKAESLGVMGLPTYIFMNGKDEKGRVIGTSTRGEFDDMLNTCLKK